MLVPREPEDWQRLFMECGVDHAIAKDRAPSFAEAIHDETFSAGLEKELPDFLATILHESGLLTRLKESGFYHADRIREMGNSQPVGSRWRSLVPRAAELEKNEVKFFDALYGGRFGNRPEGSGDGARYCGRSYIGMTFHDNYVAMSKATGLDLVGNPSQAEHPVHAIAIAVAWWEGKIPDYILGDLHKERKVVNGGYIGEAQVVTLAKLVRGALAA